MFLWYCFLSCLFYFLLDFGGANFLAFFATEGVSRFSLAVEESTNEPLSCRSERADRKVGLVAAKTDRAGSVAGSSWAEPDRP